MVYHLLLFSSKIKQHWFQALGTPHASIYLTQKQDHTSSMLNTDKDRTLTNQMNDHDSNPHLGTFHTATTPYTKRRQHHAKHRQRSYLFATKFNQTKEAESARGPDTDSASASLNAHMRNSDGRSTLETMHSEQSQPQRWGEERGKGKAKEKGFRGFFLFV